MTADGRVYVTPVAYDVDDAPTTTCCSRLGPARLPCDWMLPLPDLTLPDGARIGEAALTRHGYLALSSSDEQETIP